MKRLILPTVLAIFVLSNQQALLGAAFSPPPGGWSYVYNGDKATAGDAGSGFSSLDGTWSHDNGSDEWDGSVIGGTFGDGNRPGGAMAVTEGGVTYLRIQDTGDPRDYGYADPGSNRKIYFGHSLTERGAKDNMLDDGFTLSFRARIPTPSNTTAPLDPWHRDGLNAAGVKPYPAAGDGYVTSDAGKGNFVIKQNTGGAIAFSLTTANDTTGGALTPIANFTGLTMNENAGNVVAGTQVNFGLGTGTNVIAFNPTEWHEFWIVVRKDPSNIGTHQGYIYMDGSLTPRVFNITAGNGDDYAGISYLAIGMTATPQNSALDIDFVAYQFGAAFPSGAAGSLPPEIANFTPVPNTLFYAASKGISFTATASSNNSLVPEGFKLALNGQDVSTALKITGTAQTRTVTYASLVANSVYRGQMIVADQAGHAITNTLSFDTFAEPSAVVVEAEDYNQSSGQFQDAPAPGAYLEAAGTPGVDYSDATTAPGAAADHAYRSGDNVSTRTSTDVRRDKYVTADVQEMQVSLIQPNDWMNYTRTISNNRYAAYLRASSAVAQQVRLDRVTGNRAQPNQAVTTLGSFRIPSTGNANVFVYTPLTDAQGSAVTLDLSGVQSLRLTALSANDNLDLNFLVLAPAPAVTEPKAVTISSTEISGANLRFSFSAELGKSYRVEYKDALGPPSWTTLSTIQNAAGGPQSVTDSTAGRPLRFYRVVSL